jgi:peptidoglycan hydrolase-like protein with peptidoglycan-binding domain
MFTRHICLSLVATSMILAPVQRAQAGDAGAVLGGMILGGIIVNEVNKNKQRKRTTSTRTSTRQSSATRAENRQVQTALNYFGYNVGTADGQLGRKSRAGISRYQADMGYHVDGYLDAFEKDFLLTSHQRALASVHVAPYNQILVSQGPAGVLRTFRNEQLGIATPQQPQPQYTAQQPYVQPAPSPVPVTAPTTAPVMASVAQAPQAARGSSALPDFSFGKAALSAEERCTQVSMQTSANGGLTTASRVTDGNFALGEQFCLARTHAQTDAQRIEATIPNMNAAQVEQQCRGLAQVIAPHVEKLPATAPNLVMSEVSAVLTGSGQPMAQLVSGGKICLGVGYRIGDDAMALASALLLSSAGENGYSEMVSHHLREGFGVQASAGQAGPWMQIALSAADAGQGVLGQSPERVAVLRAAQGGTQQGALPVFGATTGN